MEIKDAKKLLPETDLSKERVTLEDLEIINSNKNQIRKISDMFDDYLEKVTEKSIVGQAAEQDEIQADEQSLQKLETMSEKSRKQTAGKNLILYNLIY
jgi:hypothetical protein